MKYLTLPIVLSTLALSGCLGNGVTTAGAGGAAANTTPTINLPVTGTGRVIARTLPGTVAQNGDGSFNVQPNSATALAGGNTGAGGATFDYSARNDPAGSTRQAGSGQQVDALVTIDNFANTGGANYVPITDEATSIYFENGNFGGPQISNNSRLNVSGVDVYNPSPFGVAPQIVLNDVTTFRANAFNGVGVQNVAFGVGFAGNQTAPAQMPVANTATYRTFIEGGVSGYNDGGTFRNASASTTPRGAAVNMVADFGAGTMTMDLNGLQYTGAGTAGAATAVRNADVDGVIFTAPIVGNTFQGTARLVNAADVNVGGTQSGEVVGGFFGQNAAEAAAGLIITGNMPIDSGDGAGAVARDYIMSWSLGGTQ